MSIENNEVSQTEIDVVGFKDVNLWVIYGGEKKEKYLPLKWHIE